MLQQRFSSAVGREMLDGRAVYVKQYLSGDQHRTTEMVRTRVAQEVEILDRLRRLSGMGGRLGVLKLVEADPESARLVTEEVAGRLLQDYLLSTFRQHTDRRCLIALFLTGKWLRVFQTLPIQNGDARGVSDDPEDLLEYCDRRMRTILEHGYNWPSPQERSNMLSVLEALAARSEECDRSKLWCHGDFASFNVMWDGQTVTTIDFAMSKLDLPLADVTYFVHRLEMLPLQYPWRRWPVSTWKRAFLRGYQRPDAEQSPMYVALTIRHQLCRLQSLVRRPGKNLRQRLHSAWLRRCVRLRLQAVMNSQLGRHRVALEH